MNKQSKWLHSGNLFGLLKLLSDQKSESVTQKFCGSFMLNEEFDFSLSMNLYSTTSFECLYMQEHHAMHCVSGLLL